MCLDDVMRSVLSTSYRRLKKEKNQVELQQLEPPDVLVSELLRSLQGQRVLQCRPITQKDSGKPTLEFVIDIPDEMRSTLKTMWLLHELRKQKLEAIAKEKAIQSTYKATAGASTSTVVPSTSKAKVASWTSKGKAVPSKAWERPGPLTAKPMARSGLTAALGRERLGPLTTTTTTTTLNRPAPLTSTMVERHEPLTAMIMERPGPSLETMRERRPMARTETPLQCGLTILAVGYPISVSVDGEEMEIDEFVSQFVESEMEIEEFRSQFVESPEIGPAQPLTYDSDGNLLHVEVKRVIASPQKFDTMTTVWNGPIQLELSWHGRAVVVGNPSAGMGVVHIKGRDWPADKINTSPI